MWRRAARVWSIRLSTTTYTLTVGGTEQHVADAVVDHKGDRNGAAAVRRLEHARMPDGTDLSGVYNFAGVRGLTPPTLKPGAEKFKIVRGGAGDVRGNTTLGVDCVPLGMPADVRDALSFPD